MVKKWFFHEGIFWYLPEEVKIFYAGNYTNGFVNVGREVLCTSLNRLKLVIIIKGKGFRKF